MDSQHPQSLQPSNHWRDLHTPMTPDELLGNAFIPSPNREIIADLQLTRNRYDWHKLSQRLKLWPSLGCYHTHGWATFREPNHLNPLHREVNVYCPFGFPHARRLHHVLDGTFRVCNCLSLQTALVAENPHEYDQRLKHLQSNPDQLERTRFEHPMVGRVYGKWEVIRSAYHDLKSGQYWFCRCTQCDSIKPVRLAHLLTGASRGCIECKDSTSRIYTKRREFKQLQTYFKHAIQQIIDESPGVEID